MNYRIRTVAEMTGIPKNTLIAWERRYGFVRPRRHENGYRAYSEEDVEKLRKVQNGIRAGLKVSEAVELLESEAQATLPVGGRGGEAAEQALGGTKSQLVDALVHYRREEAEGLLQRLAPVSFAVRLEQVFFPVLQEIGDMWERGEVTVAQEHYASNLLRTHFTAILLSLGSRGLHAPHAACTTFAGERHELAALALCIRLSLEGFRVSYLGADLPPEEAVTFCRGQKVDLLCVSLIQRFSAKEVNEYGKTIARAAEGGTRVVLGGRLLAGMRLSCPPRVEVIPEWNDLQV